MRSCILLRSTHYARGVSRVVITFPFRSYCRTYTGAGAGVIYADIANSDARVLTFPEVKISKQTRSISDDLEV
jgi:hypothetical protein